MIFAALKLLIKLTLNYCSQPSYLARVTCRIIDDKKNVSPKPSVIGMLMLATRLFADTYF